MGWFIGIAAAIARHADTSGVEKATATAAWVGWYVLGAQR